MSRYVLFAAKRHPAPDPREVLDRPGVQILDETSERAFLFEADDAVVVSIRAALPDCTVSPEVAHPPPAPVRPSRPSVRTTDTL